MARSSSAARGAGGGPQDVVRRGAGSRRSSPAVRLRNTSSRNPRHGRSRSTGHSRSRASAAIVDRISPPCAGTTVSSRTASPASPSSTVETAGSASSSARARAARSRGSESDTALNNRDRRSKCSGVPFATTRPSEMIRARVQTVSTSSRRWVEMTIALSRAISRISDRTSNFWLGSSPSVGSSRMSTSGSCSRAWARPTRRLNPFESVSIGWCRTEAMWGPFDDVPDRPPARRSEQPANVGDEPEVGGRRDVAIGRRPFRQVAEAALRGDGVDGDVHAADLDASGARRKEARDHLHRGRLAGTVRSEDPEHLATAPRSTRFRPRREGGRIAGSGPRRPPSWSWRLPAPCGRRDAETRRPGGTPIGQGVPLGRTCGIERAGL